MPLIFGSTFSANSPLLYVVSSGSIDWICRITIRWPTRILRTASSICAATVAGHPRIMHELLPGRFMRLEVEVEGIAFAVVQLKLEAALGHEPWHAAKMRRHVERLLVEVAQMLQIDSLRFRIGVRDHDQLRKPCAVWIVVHAGSRDLVPVPVHQHLRVLVAHEAQVAVGVVVVGRELPRLDRSAAREPNRRMRLL